VLAAQWALNGGHDFDGLLALLRASNVGEARGNPPIRFDQRQFLLRRRPGTSVTSTAGASRSGAQPGAGARLGRRARVGRLVPRTSFLARRPGQRLHRHRHNKTTTPDYPHYLSLGAAPWRANRLREILRGDGQFSPGDMPAIQGDLVSPLARELVRHYTAFEAQDADARRMQALLASWDCRVNTESNEALVYMETTQILLGATVNRLYEADESNAETPAADRRNILYRLLRKDDTTTLGEYASWNAAIEDVLCLAAEALRQKFGPDETKWRWGDAHWMTWRHNLGRDPELEAVFNLPNTEVGGDGATLWATQARYGRGSDHGVSYRQIFDLSDLNAARILIPPGNSGQLRLAALRRQRRTLAQPRLPPPTSTGVTSRPTPRQSNCCRRLR
jgi:hypothetical protein